MSLLKKILKKIILLLYFSCTLILFVCFGSFAEYLLLSSALVAVVFLLVFHPSILSSSISIIFYEQQVIVNLSYLPSFDHYESFLLSISIKVQVAQFCSLEIVWINQFILLFLWKLRSFLENLRQAQLWQVSSFVFCDA